LSGHQVFSFSCTACHGKYGEGKDYTEYKTGVPGILKQDFLRMASGEYISFTLVKGRSNRQMASWAPDLSGWKDAEMDSILLFITDKKGKTAHPENLLLSGGDVKAGMDYYISNCSMCHGQEGEGGIGLAIQNNDFLAAASDRFLVETIMNGRNNTAMPSWFDITAQEMNSLIAYIRSWSTGRGMDNRLNLPPGNIDQGSLNYHYLCSRCHGEFGEGDTGPSILNRNFLLSASDSYLSETISRGRSHTAMFGWSVDVHGNERLDNQDISNLISFMRSAIHHEWNYIYAGSNPGNPSSGKQLFLSNCAECHGEDGEGIEAPALHNQEFLSAASNGYLVGTISVGRSETTMPSWGRGERNYPALTGKERQDITAYIRSWQRVKLSR
jgi:mono/diheme cytochrome c family protein